MKTTINKKDFINVLTIGGAMAGKHKVIPILEYAKCKVKDKSLVVSSFDSECATLKKVGVISSDGDGDFCVICSDLLRIIKSLKDETISFSVEDGKMSIIHEKGTATLPTVDGKDFPTISKGNKDNNIEFSLDGIMLADWLTTGRNFACNDNALRPVLCGLYLYSKKNGDCERYIGCCATDANYLYTDKVETEQDVDFGVVLSNRAFAPLASIISNADEVHVVIDDKNITFSVNDAKLACRKVEGNYPNFEAIIPTTCNTKCFVDTSSVMDTLGRISLCASDSVPMLKLAVTDGQMSVSAENIDFAKKAEEKIAAQKDGADVNIWLSPSRLQTCFSNINEQSCLCEFTDGSRAMVLKEPSSRYKTILLMPMQKPQ